MTAPEHNTEVPQCDHHYGTHIKGKLHVRICTLCHTPDWNDLAETHDRLKAAERLLSEVRDTLTAEADDDFDTIGALQDLLFPDSGPEETLTTVGPDAARWTP